MTNLTEQVFRLYLPITPLPPYLPPHPSLLPTPLLTNQNPVIGLAYKTKKV